MPIKLPDGTNTKAGINIRPFLQRWLTELIKYFQIIVFTASHKSYADVVLDYIDPENKYFQHRLYRENCTCIDEGVYIKDLNIIKNRKLENLIIIDNLVTSFGFHLDNGIPIVPFYDDTNDEELYYLQTYLKWLSNQSDVRTLNKKAFQLDSIKDEFIERYLKRYDMLNEPVMSTCQINN